MKHRSDLFTTRIRTSDRVGRRSTRLVWPDRTPSPTRVRPRVVEPDGPLVDAFGRPDAWAALAALERYQRRRDRARLDRWQRSLREEPPSDAAVALENLRRAQDARR